MNIKFENLTTDDKLSLIFFIINDIEDKQKIIEIINNNYNLKYNVINKIYHDIQFSYNPSFDINKLFDNHYNIINNFLKNKQNIEIPKCMLQYILDLYKDIPTVYNIYDDISFELKFIYCIRKLILSNSIDLLKKYEGNNIIEFSKNINLDSDIIEFLEKYYVN